MTKAEIVDKTLESIRQVPIQNLTPFDSEAGCDELVIADLQDRLPHNVDIKTCEDVRYPGVECCAVCHGPYAHYKMFLIGMSDGGLWFSQSSIAQQGATTSSQSAKGAVRA